MKFVPNEPSLDLQRWLWGPIWLIKKQNEYPMLSNRVVMPNQTDRWHSRSCKSRFWETFEKILFKIKSTVSVMLQLFEPKILEKPTIKEYDDKYLIL
jgi:hypothetical protein